ncbi:MAG TPA: POTRA domain-containing protein [Nitrospiraceae bacterium]|nr:POTRA domain-containing protein [Nitrospiraceae bacterium]
MSRFPRAAAWILLLGCLVFPLGQESRAGEARGAVKGDLMMAQLQDSPGSAQRDPMAGKSHSNGDPPTRDTDSAEKAESAPAGETQTTRFAVKAYVVDGNTILKQNVIDAILDKYKGSDMQLSNLEKARAELENAYHNAGYPTVLVNLPEQTVESGVVKLQVIEAPLVEISVTGNQYYKRYQILEKLPSVQYGAVLYEPTFAKELAALNANPDLKVAPVLKPGSEPGTVSLELKVKDRLPVHAKLEADNRGPITTPRDRMIAEVQYTNLLGGDEILTASTVQTPTDWGTVQSYSMSFVAPIIWPDHLFALYASHSQSNSTLAGGSISTGGGNVGVAGNATIAGTRYYFPIFSGGQNTHQLAIGMDFKHLDRTEATFPGGLGTITVVKPIQYTPMSLAYTGSIPDTFGVNRLTATVKGYIAGMIPGGTKQDFEGTPNDPNNPPVRVGSTGTFAVLQGGAERYQSLPQEFLLTLHVDGQWATQPLVPAEQYFAGGMDTVRGYINYETAGDNAVRGRAELLTPELLTIPLDRIWQRKRSSDYSFKLRLLAFYDIAKLWVEQPQPGQIDHFNLQGTGFGIRVSLPKDVGILKVDQGWALHDTPTTKRGDTFVHFSVGVAY